MAGDPALATCGLSKRVRRRTVVDSVDVRIEQGEIYGLIGSDSIGASMLAKLVCGLAVPSSGTVEVLETRMKPGAFHPHVGFLVGRGGFQPGMTGFDNVLCRALALGLADPRSEAQRAIDLCGLSAVSHHASGSYPPDARQRLGIALALVGTPRLVVLDDPFKGIDLKVTLELRRVFSGLAARNGVAFMVASPVPDQLHRLATRYGAMAGGRLVAERTAAQVDQESASDIVVRSDRAEAALAVLEQAFPHASVVCAPDGSVRLDGSVGTGAVAHALFSAHIEPSDIYLRENSLASYFNSLLEMPAEPTREETPC